MRVKRLKGIFSWVIPIVVGLALALLIRQFWFTMVKVQGTSMQPNLQSKERVIAVKTVPIKADSVIVFKAYGVNQEEQDRRADYVKRVIGLPGDTVRYTRRGQLYVNDKLVKQSYLKNQFQQTTGTYMANRHSQMTGWTLTSLSHDQSAWQVKVTTNRVPKGYYFVMGDHRSVSNDSRSWGFVPKKAVVGVVHTWPWQARKQYLN
ncbi:signal peptidase I [Lactiplantibacillus nangangensis]|uniref:Signal peptidase I n=1 Tax=Lactiplantibacillus nangangensis TaxID=2559917 RepID=A0ABW1SN68_9LACO|nr:signal peptidase I [Lactiplantibacillus nangangensis]